MEKDIHTAADSASTSAKEDIMHIEDTKMTKNEKIAAIDAIAEDPSVTLESFAHLDINKILRKIDMRLVPMLTVLVSTEFVRTELMQREELLMPGQYLLSFLDRGNIGNAKIEGLAEDLHLTGAEYNWCLTGMYHRVLSESLQSSADVYNSFLLYILRFRGSE